MRRSVAVLAALVSLCGASACDTECADRDGDGLGEGCAAGDDCDDTNQARTDDCDRVPAPDCTSDFDATGCPCLEGLSGTCYDAPRATLGLGACTTGFHRCVGGHWSLCDGQVTPVFERCNQADDDCDGEIDEGVVSPCGGCTPGCVGDVWGRDGEPFSVDAGERIVVLDDGRVTLALEPTASDALWVANSGDATVSRIDTEGAVEAARYPSGGPEPSRVAVDYVGDAYVANRAFDGVGSLTKIASEDGRCVDRDRDGTIRTSRGPLDVLEDDECVVWTVPVGELGEVPRALAIDADRGLDGITGGAPWVGLDAGQRVLRLDPIDGSVRDEVVTPDFQPYGAAFDSQGVLWLVEREGHVARIDPRQRPVRAEILEIPFACNLGYAIAIDPSDRVVVTGFSCDAVYRLDPASGEWTSRATDPSPRGVAIAPTGEVWIAHTGALVSRLFGESLRLEQLFDLVRPGVTPRETIGIAVAHDGSAWSISERSGDTELGIATRIDASDGPIDDVVVGRAPHTQGDLTGGALRAAFVPDGFLRRVFDGCGETLATRWERVHLVADLVGASAVVLRTRHARRSAELAAAPFVELGTLPDDDSPFALDLPESGVVEVEATLVARDRASAPRLVSIGVEWECPGPD
ncbi:MAG: hypothetical protein IT379_09905 [Deltaproteobacteria bacterium]|nr:hypothetical protein [Deltaproteobacteria bacterium]